MTHLLTIRTGVISTRLLGCALLSIVVSACAMHRHGAVAAPSESAEGAVAREPAMPSPEALETFITKVRKLSMEARPQKPAAATIEGNDPRLAAALAAAMMTPSPERLRLVASEYERIGVNDRAYEYLTKAVTRDPHDAASYDALARLWRNSGFPQRGLGDAYRAIHYAPSSPIVHNTLGTLLQGLGMRGAARLEYERALRLDPTAVYALTNLCYSWMVDGRSQQAAVACDRALQLNPAYAPARNNLALAYAVGGDVAAAQSAFERIDDPAVAIYNIGLMHLARHEYPDALEAFARATKLDPTMRVASARMRQVQQAVENGEEE